MVSMEIPGMEASSICISVDGNELIISGEKRMPEERLHASRDITREMAFGKFERRITLTGHRLKKTENDASYKDGVLTVSLPYDGTEQLRTARTIPVQ
jgi:HSP20 family protein